jgi:predicted small integral membrane protein
MEVTGKYGGYTVYTSNMEYKYCMDMHTYIITDSTLKINLGHKSKIMEDNSHASIFILNFRSGTVYDFGGKAVLRQRRFSCFRSFPPTHGYQMKLF